MIEKLIAASMKNAVVVFLLAIAIVWLGWVVSPYGPHLKGVVEQVPVDAIPDIGENQQIVFTQWPGRSPQDVEDQVTYPLTSSLLGMPGVKTIRSNSMFGFSTVYVIFDDKVDFYFSRTRILEKLNSLPPGTLPEGVVPTLGPDATALGQVFWYTLEGRDADGNPAGGWDLNELRSIQDWTVRYSLMSATGVAEVASVGGFVQEYHIDVNPQAMINFEVTLRDIYRAVGRGNIDVGGGTLEVNGPEYFIRGIGFVRTIEDLENVVIKVVANVPVRLIEVASVSLGPASRRGLLDREGTEAVGGVVVSRFGANPLRTIEAVQEQIERLAPSLPSRTLADGRVSKVTIVPFYNRAELIGETLGTLSEALSLEVLITIIVILFLVMHLRSALLISGLLPLTILATFIAMWGFGVDANIVALSGIAIAIGTIVDMGIVMCENILRRLKLKRPDERTFDVVFSASHEVGGAVFTAVATTVISFLPVFFMEGAEGKLFKPLAYTKTFALMASVGISLVMIPCYALILMRGRSLWNMVRDHLKIAGVLLLVLMLVHWQTALVAVLAVGLDRLLTDRDMMRRRLARLFNILLACTVIVLLAQTWLPLGTDAGSGKNLTFTAVLILALLGGSALFIRIYPFVLRWCLEYKGLFLILPSSCIILGLTIWLGFPVIFSWVPNSMDRIGMNGDNLRSSKPWVWARHAFPGLGEEFMPPLDEGSFLYMPTTMPHASLNEGQDILARMDMAIRAIPEVSEVVGKLGRVESSLDPAPVSMVETVINYLPEYKLDAEGKRGTYRYDKDAGTYPRDEHGNLIPDEEGRPYRQWREHIQSPDDIWDEIVAVAEVPGATSAPKLQPISTRLVMLQSGMRAPMGVKIKGPTQESIEEAGLAIEQLMKDKNALPAVLSEAVLADRIVGKPYLEFHIMREAIARYGLNVRDVTDIIEMAISGKMVSQTVEGRERYAIRLRYPRELRDDLESIQDVLVPVRGDLQIPLRELATLKYAKGPQSIKSEDAELVSYVLFDKRPGFSEVQAVEQARAYLLRMESEGKLSLPAGVRYSFTGTFENQVRSKLRLMFIMPLAGALIFLILYLQFRDLTSSLIIFSGVFVALAGGFLMLWCYGQPNFLDFEILGTNMHDVFQVKPYNLSVAVWVGFLALFGIATDDGVIMGTYLRQLYQEEKPQTLGAIRAATIRAAMKRIRPCMMTSATTILALIPILTSTGRGSDIMIPMAIPSFGGMVIVLITIFVVPTLFCMRQEWRMKAR